MYKELSDLLTKSENGVAKDIAQNIFKNIKANSQEELNTKSALLKQSFLNAFELQFEIEFLNASEKVQ